MEQNTKSPPLPDPDRVRVYPLESFLTVQRLLKKLNMTPADGLQLLAEVLEDLDRQVDEFDGDGLPFPPQEVFGDRTIN